MPLIRISLIEGRTASEKLEVARAVHDALIATFKIPADDKNIRIMEYNKEDWILPPGKSEKYILAEISVFKGRSLDAKRALYKSVVENLGKLGIAKEDVFIILYEEPTENWGIRGGTAACDVNFGFDINV